MGVYTHREDTMRKIFFQIKKLTLRVLTKDTDKDHLGAAQESPWHPVLRRMSREASGCTS